MHIPEGMLSVPVTAAAAVVSAGGVGLGVRWVRRNLDERRVVLMAVLGALIFALQMLNFPIQAGTSGHFAGGALAGIVLGIWPASLVMTVVLAVQAFLFADGGVVALGANVLNLGLIAPLIGYTTYSVVASVWPGRTGKVVGAFAAAWLSTVVSALAVAIELAVSGTANFGVAVLAMVGTHALIGIGEGAITAGLVSYVYAVRPDLLDGGARGGAGDGVGGGRTGGRLGSLRPLLATFAVLAVLAAASSFLASSSPDGLEWVYFDQGIGDAAAVETAPSLIGNGGPFADYGVAGLGSEKVGSAIAGVVGLSIVGGLLALIAWRRRGQYPVNTDSNSE